MEFPLKHKTTFGFGVAALLIVAISMLSWHGNWRQSNEAEWVRQTQEVLTRLETLLSGLTDGETGQRGFILTGDETYLEPYQAYLPKAEREYQALQRLTADDPPQQARLTHLRPLLRERADELAKNIELRREHGLEAATQSLQSGRGKVLHDRIRAIISEMEQIERELLAQRSARTAAFARLARWSIGVGGLLAVGIVIAALVLIHRDIAHRQRIEAELLSTNAALRTATERAQHADRVKSAFLATMSHELRTPLNSIIGFSGILLQELPGPLNPEQKKQLGMVRDSSRHLLALVNDVLDISKIEANQLRVRRIPFPLAASIDKTIKLVTPLAEKKGLALRAQIAPDLGEIVADPRRVEQVLFNLLNNAIKFTEHGRITVSAERMADISRAGAAGPQPGVRLRVEDTGIGIRPEEMDQLFQPFHQAESGLARSHDGTGLGLAISHRLLALMGGQISVESTFGEGSLFTFLLPSNGAATP
ncbi:MAG: CHASE3 domain-containing protein [Candidatus Competibacter sp.]|nr:CHASE3 domain-containing protein [Candidatus Competibacter sp.]MDG4584481.1 CHASE3 domain-containing protein [Candidatus Competibacter sp.]